VTPNQINALLSRSEYFGGLAPASRSTLAELCRLESVPKRDFLFMEGQPGTSVYLLAEGALQLLKTSEDGRDIVIRLVEPGDVFAEAVLFERDTYPVSAVAMKASRVLSLNTRDFRRLLDRSDFRDDFLRYLTGRLRYLADRILYLTAYDVESRFFRFLEQQYGRSDHYTLSLPKKDIAAAIGTTPETYSRLMQQLEAQGQVKRSSGKGLDVAPTAWERNGL
jgi:CRP/FNR family transcriptional regulator